MASDVSAFHLDTLQTIFGEIIEPNVVFVIDSSTSNNDMLATIKKHLIETLVKMAHKKSMKHKFNMIHFSKRVWEWSDKLIDCNIETVTVATSWIRSIHVGVGCVLVEALVKAFESENINAVYFVSDGAICVENEEKLLKSVRYISRDRPIHTIQLVNQLPPDRSDMTFMSRMAGNTSGRYSLIELNRSGAIERVTPVFSGTRDVSLLLGFTPPTTSSTDTSLLTEFSKFKLNAHKDPLLEPMIVAPRIAQDERTGKLVESPFYHPHNHWYWPKWIGFQPSWMTESELPNNIPPLYAPWNVWTHHRAARAFINGTEELDRFWDNPQLAPSAGAFMLRRTVAVRDPGQPFVFHKGVVQSQIGRGMFLVVLHSHSNASADDKTAMEVSAYDMIDVDNAQSRDIECEDGVLVPEGGDRFHLAQVTQGQYQRTFKSDNGCNLQVKLLHNQSIQSVDARLLLKLPKQLFLQLSEVPANNLQVESAAPPAAAMTQQSNNSNIRYDSAGWTEHPHVSWGDTKKGAVLPHSRHPIYPSGELVRTEGQVSHTRKEIEEKAEALRKSSTATIQMTVEKPTRKKTSKPAKPPSLTSLDQISHHHDDSSSADSSSEDSDSSASVGNFYRYGGRKHDVGVSTDLSLASIQFKQKSSSLGELRAPWRYWGIKPLPDIIDPPSHDPYQQPSSWGFMPETPIVTHTHLGPQNEWSSPNFQTVNPMALSKVNPYQMFEILQHKVHQPTPPPKRNVAVGADTPAWTVAEIRAHKEMKRWQQHMDMPGYPEVAKLSSGVPLYRSSSAMNLHRPKMSRVEIQKAMDEHNREVFRQSQENSLRLKQNNSKVSFAAQKPPRPPSVCTPQTLGNNHSQAYRSAAAAEYLRFCNNNNSNTPMHYGGKQRIL